MALDVLLIREGNRLAAYDAVSAEAIDTIKSREIVTATLRRPRNPAHHRKLWALIGAVFENQTAYQTSQELLSAIKLATGLFDTGRTVDGIPYVVPKSISFASMCQHEFEQWYDRAVQVILTKIVPGLSRADLEARVLEILGNDQFNTKGKKQCRSA